jgi:hypothetical protein
MQRSFVTTSKRDQNNPEQIGLVRRPNDFPPRDGDDEMFVYVRPDADPSDPRLIWNKPEPGFGVRSDRSDGKWVLVLPLRGQTGAPPLGEADWDDTRAIADLADMTKHPAGAWTLYSLNHPDVLADHQRAEAEHQRHLQAQADRRAREDGTRRSWQPLRAAGEVSPDTLRNLLRNAHAGDTGPVTLAFQSLPMQPKTLLDDPAVAARFGFAEPWVDESGLHLGVADSAGYPVAGWKMILQQPTNWGYSSLSRDQQQTLGRDWAERIAEVVEPRGLRVTEVDGRYWVIRDQQVFDVLHAAKVAAESDRNRRYRSDSRTVEIPKRGQYRR